MACQDGCPSTKVYLIVTLNLSSMGDFSFTEMSFVVSLVKWCGVHQLTPYSGRLTTFKGMSGTVNSTVCQDQHAQKSRSLLSERSADDEALSTVHTTSSSRLRTEREDKSFPSADSPLANQTWRQFLTSDEKTIVCVHPVKPVEFSNTKVVFVCTV